VYASEDKIFGERLSLDVLQIWQKTVALNGDVSPLKVVLGNGRLVYSEDPADNHLARPVTSPADIDYQSSYGLYLQGELALNENRYDDTIKLLKQSLSIEPYALRDPGSIYCRRGRFDQADSCARVILPVDAYDPNGNFLYGLVNSRLGKTIDAVDGFKVTAL
jgi:tetratricopeptide (TPR) repeat protein